MKYKVVKDFKDLQDKGHVYRVGDKYPRKGKVKSERVEELLSSKNKQKMPLIEEVKE